MVLTNVGATTASFELASDRGWLSVTPMDGTLEPGAAADLSVAVAACTAEGSETGSVAVVDGAVAAAIAVRRDCTEPIDLPTLDLALDRLYVNQSVPAQDTARPTGERVALVADRPGLLRVFVTANEANDVQPIVRLHYRYGGGPESVLDLSGPDAVPLAVDEGTLGQTFVAELAGDVVRPGLEAYVEVVLAGEVDASNNRYPAEGYWVPDVVVVPEARFTLVPVTYGGATPSVGDGSAYLGLTERMFPIAGVDVAGPGAGRLHGRPRHQRRLGPVAERVDLAARRGRQRPALLRDRQPGLHRRRRRHRLGGVPCPSAWAGTTCRAARRSRPTSSATTGAASTPPAASAAMPATRTRAG